MKVTIVCLIVLIFLFAIAFVAKKRFGLLGLALAAGYILSDVWGESVGIAASIAGLPDNSQTNAMVASVLILLPALLLMFHGYSYKSFLPRVFGALIFCVLAVTFILKSIGGNLVWDSSEISLYKTFTDYSDYVIGTGLAFSVIDLFFTKPAKKAEKGKEH